MSFKPRRELPLNPYASEPLSIWEARLSASGSAEERFRAFAALTQLAAIDDACEHAVRLSVDADAELRAAATRWLSNAVRSGRVESELASQRETLVKCLHHSLNDADPDVQLEAARGLVRLVPDCPHLAEVVCELLVRSEAQSTTQATLAELCGWLPVAADQTLPVLGTWLSAESGEVREAAAAALARLGARSAPLEAALVAALDDEEPIVREQAAVALGQLPALSEISRTALQGASVDEDEAVASAARSALERHPT